jgi:hypothetical protein
MELRDWLRHPLRCLWAVIDGHLHADCRGRYEITPEGRETLSHAAAHHVIRADGDSARVHARGSHLRMADQRSSSDAPA